MTQVRNKGFTLIEIMIVLGIVAILVALAVPSFQDAVRKSRRADAMDTILSVYLAEQKFRANNISFGTLVNLGMANPLVSPNGHYSITVNRPLLTRATAYAITATAVGTQASDYCGNFTLTYNAGVVTKTTSSGIAADCWKK